MEERPPKKMKVAKDKKAKVGTNSFEHGISQWALQVDIEYENEIETQNNDMMTNW